MFEAFFGLGLGNDKELRRWTCLVTKVFDDEFVGRGRGELRIAVWPTGSSEAGPINDSSEREGAMT